eukprot:m.13975 g.13975  ORF g.13975 m.13975 type:complete len:191 (+) comp7476_c0_seq1:341-913(+)
MAEQSVVRPLFGGAMSMAMPQRFDDISLVREVPDNQEVFADGSTDQSFIVEILEIPADSPDAEAARFHFEVIASEGNADATEIETETQATMLEGNIHRTITWGLQRVRKHRDVAAFANDVRVHVACFRIPRVGADIVLSFNSPTFINQRSSVAENVSVDQMAVFNSPEHAINTFMQAVETLQIHNWGLFA